MSCWVALGFIFQNENGRNIWPCAPRMRPAHFPAPRAPCPCPRTLRSHVNQAQPHAVNHSCNTTPLFLTRGPGFKITSAAFAPLCPDRPDYPSTAQVVAAVRSELSQAPQKHDSVVFAGFGEPTLRLPDLLEITRVSEYRQEWRSPHRSTALGCGSRGRLSCL